MSMRSPRRLLGSAALLAVTLGSAGADPPDAEQAPGFIARWGGRTKDLGFGTAAGAKSVFVTGGTWSADFPVSAGKPPAGDAWCAFLTQLARADGALARSITLCGRGMTYGRAVARDGSDAAWVGGSSDGPDLPVSRNAFQPRYHGGSAAGPGDAFIAHWNTGGQMDYVTYLGGAGDETVWAMASDGSGGVWAAGGTTSRPLAGGVGSLAGTMAWPDGFLAHITADRRLGAIKILGGDGVDELYDVALVDPGRLVVVGATASSDRVLGGPRGGLDGFVVLLDPATLKVAWTLRLGGVGADALRGVTVVDGRRIVAAGHTDGGACQPRLGGRDGWLVSISLAGEVLRSDCVGSGTTDVLSDVAVAGDGVVWVTGTTDAALPHRAGSSRTTHHRAFVARARPTGGTGPLRLLSNEIAWGYAITADAEGRVYAVGETTAVPSTTGPWVAALHPTAGAFRGSYPPGSTDPYVIALPPN